MASPSWVAVAYIAELLNEETKLALSLLPYPSLIYLFVWIKFPLKP